MKIRSPWTNIVILTVCVCLCIALPALAAPDKKAGVAKDQKFEEYRAAIKKEYGIDIKNFKDGIKGGKADGQKITKYDLNQLLMGIKVEQEHTTDKMKALEISMDHLEEFPDYYTRLLKMEEDAEKEMEARKAKK